MKIGNITLDNPFILAPMAGVSDLAFRLLCREMGAGMVCTEMVSAKALHYKSEKTKELMVTDEREAPVSLQIFGSDAEIMGDIAGRLSREEPFDIIDINMGCPVPKIVNNHEGSALMLEPMKAANIIENVVKKSEKPVTVKLRIGFDEDNLNVCELAHIAQEQGAAAVAIHGRTRMQYYSGKADWTMIGKVKEKLTIPVIGNGDVFTAEDGLRMMKETGCDGVIVARGARGNPWIFRELLSLWKDGEVIAGPTIEEKKDMILRHAKMQVELKGEYMGIRQMRKHLGWYTVGMKNSAKLRGAACQIESLEELERLLSVL